MPSLSSATQAQLLGALFQGTALPPASTLYLALHNENPGGPGTQSTGETAYTNYARVAVPCSPGSWRVSGAQPAQAQNIQQLAFPACGATGDLLAFWSLGYQASGPGPIITSGPLGPGTAYQFTASWMNDALFVPLLPPGWVPGQAVVLYQFGPGMLLPGGFVDGQLYSVGLVSGTSVGLTNLFGGPLIVPTTPGGGLIVPVSLLAVSAGIVPTFAPSSLFTFVG